MKASVFVGVSLDGFIARADGALDFLPPGGGKPHGYDEFMASLDAPVVGRKTFCLAHCSATLSSGMSGPVSSQAGWSRASMWSPPHEARHGLERARKVRMSLSLVALLSAVDVPDHFMTSTPAGAVKPRPDEGCRSPIIDPRDQTRRARIRSAGGRGDCEPQPLRYGLGDGELLRVDCASGRAVGIVRR
jgi:hypothetical protein